MATFLQMDGIDDKIESPKVTVSKIILDFSYEENTVEVVSYYLIDARISTPSGNNMVFIGSKNILTKGNGISSLLLNGVPVTSTANLSYSSRYKIEVTFVNLITSPENGIDFFVNYINQNSTRTKGKIFRISGYNGESLVFDYDMSTGTVLDQSGNGKHATLTGGSWGTETPATTTQEGQANVSIESNAIASGLTVQSGTMLIAIESDVNALGSQTQSGASSISGESLVSAGIFIDTFGNTSVSGESNASLSALAFKSASSSVSSDSNASLTATLSTFGQANVSSETSATATYIPDSTVVVPETPEISGSVSVESNVTAVLTPIINGVAVASSESYATVIGSQVQSGNGNTSIATESTLETSSVTYGQYSVSIESSTSLMGTKVTIGESFVFSTSSAIAEFIHEIPAEYEKSIDVQLFVVRDLNKTLSIQREINATLTV